MTVPRYPSRKASGIETMPGLSSGNQWKSIDGSVNSDGRRCVNGSTGLPDTTGENAIRMSVDASPP